MVTILLELIVILGISYLLLRLIIPFLKKDQPKTDIEKSVKDGFRSAIKELEQEKEAEEELFKTIKEKSNSSTGIFSSINQEERPLNTDGDLIPANLTDNEKEILRMFYSQ